MSNHNTAYWQQRVRRRRVLKALTFGGLGLTAAGVIGCARRETPQPPAPGAAPEARQPKRGGTIARQGGLGSAEETVGRSFDPHVEPSTVLGMPLRLIYQALLGYDLATYEVQPDLAQSWEQPSPTEYSFKLTSGVKWHNKPPANGRELVADDVVFSLNRARTEEPRFVNRSLLASVDRIEAVDKTTVRVTSKRPDVTVLSVFGSDALAVLNPEVVERSEKLATPDQAVGTGAFIMKDVQERIAGEYIRNPSYFRPGLPYLDAVRTPVFNDAQAAYAAFLAGRLDIVGRLPGTQVRDHIARQGPAFMPRWFERDAAFFLTPNVTRRPFDDPRVTRALRLLTDHHEFISAYAEVQFGRGRHGSIFSSALGRWDVPQEDYERHIFWQRPKEAAIREALALLSAAGFTAASPLRFELSTFDSPLISPGAELLHAQFRRNGQGVVQPSDLKLYDAPTFSRITNQGTFEYGYYPVSAALVEPGVWLTTLWHTGGSRNYWRFSDPRLDEMIDRQNRTFDAQARKDLITEIVRYMMENSPGVPGANTLSLNAVNPKIRDFVPEGNLNGRQYQWIWLDA